MKVSCFHKPRCHAFPCLGANLTLCSAVTIANQLQIRMFYLFAPPTCRLHALLETCMSSRISPHPALELAHAQALTGKLCGADFPPAAPHGRAAVRLLFAHLIRIGADGNFHRGQAMAVAIIRGSFVEKLRVTESEHHHHKTKIIVSSWHLLNSIITKQRSLCPVGTC